MLFSWLRYYQTIIAAEKDAKKRQALQGCAAVDILHFLWYLTEENLSETVLDNQEQYVLKYSEKTTEDLDRIKTLAGV